MNRAVKNFNNLLNISFLMIALDILVGGLLLFYTELASTVAVVVAGCLILVHGIFALIDYFYVGMLFNFLKYLFKTIFSFKNKYLNSLIEKLIA